jgi:hypothetical protein
VRRARVCTPVHGGSSSGSAKAAWATSGAPSAPTAVHDAVAQLDGSTPARQAIVHEALGYLERLSTEAGDDPTLRLELVEAYTRVARAQGDPQQPNLGDRDGAMASFTRARGLVEPLLSARDIRVRTIVAMKARGCRRRKQRTRLWPSTTTCVAAVGTTKIGVCCPASANDAKSRRSRAGWRTRSRS